MMRRGDELETESCSCFIDAETVHEHGGIREETLVFSSPTHVDFPCFGCFVFHLMLCIFGHGTECIFALLQSMREVLSRDGWMNLGAKRAYSSVVGC